MANFLRETAEGITISVKIQPRASKNEIVGFHGDALKIRLTAPPIEGAANALLITFLSDKLDLPKQNFELVQGLTSRNKLIRVIGATKELIIEKLL